MTAKDALRLKSGPESQIDFYQRWHHLARPYFKWQFDQFKPYLGRRIADLGCGLGNFTDFLLDRERYLGMDISPEYIQVMQERHARSNTVSFRRCDIDSPLCVDLLRQEEIDTVICVNLLEHIEDDRRALTNVVHALSEGGTVCLLVPAFQILFGTLDELDSHYRRYDKTLLRELLKDLPVYTLTMYYFNFVGALGWYLKGRVLRQKVQTDDNYKIMNSLIPYVSKLEKLTSPFFGMSLISVLRKTR